MEVSIDGVGHDGRAIALGSDVDPHRIVRAIRGEDVGEIAVETPDPAPVHRRVGLIDGDDSVVVRAALAAAARSRGETAPQDESIAECRARLAELDPPTVDAVEARRRTAEAGETEARLHERVAEIRGRVQTLRSRGADAALAEAEAELAEATAALTEARTERIAAQQAVEQAADRARSARDRREERMRLEDRIGNLRRAARAHLASEFFEEFEAAVSAVPGEGEVLAGSDGEVPGFEGPDTTAVLAIARVAALRAPVVLACGRFTDAETAAECLDAPVIRIGGG